FRLVQNLVEGRLGGVEPDDGHFPLLRLHRRLDQPLREFVQQVGFLAVADVYGPDASVAQLAEQLTGIHGDASPPDFPARVRSTVYSARFPSGPTHTYRSRSPLSSHSTPLMVPSRREAWNITFSLAASVTFNASPST